MALHKWSDKPVEERTYDELLERFRAWIVDRKKYENFLKVTNRASAPDVKPTVAPVTDADGGTKNGKKKKKKKKKSNGVDSDSSDPSVAAVTRPAKPKGKCMNFQKKYGAKGCNKGKKCPYEHELCETQEEFNELVKRVTQGTPANSGDERGVPSPPAPGPGSLFRKKFCRYGSSCKFKDEAGDKQCKRNHTTYPTLAKWKEGLKATGAKGDSSD